MTERSEQHARLPKDVQRLVRLGGGAVGAFLVFVLVWSIGAQITTTLRLPGVLSPQAPTHEVQHEAGGRVARLDVALHQEVEAGAPLLALDVSDELVQRAALQARAAVLEAELSAILPRLGRDMADPKNLLPSVSLAYAAQDALFHTQIEQLNAEEDALTRRSTVLAARYEAQGARMELVQARFNRGVELSEKGLMTQREIDAIEGELHAGKTLLLTLDAEHVELDQRRRDVVLSRKRLKEERRERLTDLRLQHERDLIEIRARIDRLSAKIEQAEIRAPVAGKVTEMAVSTAGQVAAPGLTILTLTQEPGDPMIDLYVPPSYIDQVRVGQEGLLTVTSLSQRTAPRLRAVLTELAREPAKDAEGNSSHYLARAEINAEDLAAAQAELGSRFQLSVGMPVSAAMNGRNTTLWEFVTGPFTGLLGTAFED